MPRRNPELRRFGDNVRQLREKQGLSQERLAELANLDRTYIGGLERGEYNAVLKRALAPPTSEDVGGIPAANPNL